MIQEKLVRGDLLYHSAHGLCRVNDLIKENRSGKEVLSYALVPRIAARMKVRFVIADSGMEASGFHPLISVREANKIMNYLKTESTLKPVAETSTRDEDLSRFDRENHPWQLAKGLLFFSRAEGFQAKDQRKHQILKRSVKGLVEELAFVLKITVKETADKIRTCLSGMSKINPLVLSALEQAANG